MSEENKKQIEEYLDSVKDEINSISWRIEELRDELIKLLAAIDREEREESEENFGILIKAGFVIGTKFKIDDGKEVFTITGINRDGYVVEYDKENGEHQKTRLRTDSKSYLDKILPRMKIVTEVKP